MPLPSPLFWLIILFLVILVWLDGLVAGKAASAPGTPGQPSLWQRTGQYFRRFIKNPTPGTILGLFVVLILLRLLIGLLPLLAFLIAAWAVR